MLLCYLPTMLQSKLVKVGLQHFLARKIKQIYKFLQHENLRGVRSP